jgi:hypothetical protein
MHDFDLLTSMKKRYYGKRISHPRRPRLTRKLNRRHRWLSCARSLGLLQWSQADITGSKECWFESRLSRSALEGINDKSSSRLLSAEQAKHMDWSSPPSYRTSMSNRIRNKQAPNYDF